LRVSGVISPESSGVDGFVGVPFSIRREEVLEEGSVRRLRTGVLLLYGYAGGRWKHIRGHWNCREEQSDRRNVGAVELVFV